MSLHNTRNNEVSRGEKRQDQNPGFPTSVLLVFCDNTEDQGSIPKTGERDNVVDLEGNTGSLRIPGSQPGFSLVWKHSLGSPELDLRMLSKFKIVYFILKC